MKICNFSILKVIPKIHFLNKNSISQSSLVVLKKKNSKFKIDFYF